MKLSLDQALIVVGALKREQEYLKRIIQTTNNRDEMQRVFILENKVSMLIKDLEYKISTENL